MAYITKFDGKTDNVINLGNKDKSTDNPTSIEGYYLGTKEIPDSGYGVGKLHLFQTKSGTVGVWGKTNSNRLMTPDLVGSMVLLSFTGMGERRKGKNPAYEYSLQYDPQNKTDTSSVDLSYTKPDADESEVDEEEDKPAARGVPTAERQAAIQAQLRARSK